MTVNFITYRETDEQSVMHSKSDRIKIMISDKADEVLEEPFQSLLSRYQIGLETTMKGSDFMFVCVYLLFYKSHKIEFQHGESYINSADWIKSKQATINLLNKKDNKCFQYAKTVTLKHKEIKKHPSKNNKS